MKVTWEVDDGYVGKSRPQFTDIDDEELEGMGEEERIDYIDECVRYDFEESISFSIIYISEDE